MTFPFPDVSDAPLADLLSLRGRRTLVTGAAQGLGYAIAVRLAEAGAAVAVADLDLSRAREAADRIAAAHGVPTLGVGMDVTSVASVSAGADDVVAEWGGLDVWVNNAGVFPSIPLTDMTAEQWDDVFAVNARGVFLGARESARRMVDGGVIINIVSTAGFEGTAAGLAAYVGSKHAARGLTKQLAIELAPRGIRVLGVAPSFVPTEGNLAAAAAALPTGMDPLSIMQPKLIGRHGTPDDIARVVLFCASDLSLVMTGSTLLADAGHTA